MAAAAAVAAVAAAAAADAPGVAVATSGALSAAPAQATLSLSEYTAVPLWASRPGSVTTKCLRVGRASQNAWSMSPHHLVASTRSRQAMLEGASAILASGTPSPRTWAGVYTWARVGEEVRGGKVAVAAVAVCIDQG